MLTVINSKDGDPFSLWCAHRSEGYDLKLSDGSSMWYNVNPVGNSNKTKTLTDESYCRHLRCALLHDEKKEDTNYFIDLSMLNSATMILMVTFSSEGKSDVTPLLTVKLQLMENPTVEIIEVFSEVSSRMSEVSSEIALLKQHNAELLAREGQFEEELNTVLSMKDSLVDSLLVKMCFVLNQRKREAHQLRLRLKKLDEADQARTLLAQERSAGKGNPSRSADSAALVAAAVAAAEERHERAAALAEEAFEQRMAEAVSAAVERAKAVAAEEAACAVGCKRKTRCVPRQSKTTYIQRKREGTEGLVDGEAEPKRRRYAAVQGQYRRQSPETDDTQHESQAFLDEGAAETFFATQTQEVESSQLMYSLTQSAEYANAEVSSHSPPEAAVAFADGSFLDFTQDEGGADCGPPRAESCATEVSDLQDAYSKAMSPPQVSISSNGHSSGEFSPDVLNPPVIAVPVEEAVESVSTTRPSSVFVRGQRLAQVQKKYRSALSRFADTADDSDASSDFG